MSTTEPTNPKMGEGTPTKKRRWRWARRIVLGLLLGAALVLAAMRSPVTGWVAARQIGRHLGCEAKVGSAVVQFDGRVIITNLVLRVPELAGPAGEFLRARRVEVDVNWSPIAGLSAPTVAGVRMYEPLARVSVLRGGSGVSLARLKPAVGGGGGGRPPRIDAFGAIMEFGEHELDGAYTVLKSIPVTGSLSPLSDAEPKFSVKLQEIQRPGRDKGLLLEGELDLSGAGSGPLLELRLYNVELARWGTDTVPTVMRDVWSTLGMRGRVSLATLRFDGASAPGAAGAGSTGGTGGAGGPGGDFRIGLELADVAMNALIPSDVPSRPGADRPLVLTDVNGSITFETKGVTARLRGKVKDMPAQVVLTTEGIGRDAPVRCELIIERFEVSKEPDLMPYAPPIVRENFARFSGPTAVVDARVVVTRGHAQGGRAGTLSTSGSISFENGAAAFEKFAYPVEQMRGMVRFDDRAVELVNIRGRGRSGAIVSIDGRISPPRKGAEMLINALVLDAPIDEHLIGAMSPSKREVLDKLFNQTAADELARQGLTVTAAEHAEAVAALEHVRTERAAAERAPVEPGASEFVTALAVREAELVRDAQRPVFELGGKVGLEVRVFSPLDRNEWDWSVNVRFPRAGVLPSAFPLPMILTDGLLKLNEFEARLESGTFAGISGGSATVAALVKFDGPHAEPDVRVVADGVPVDALLLHAVAYDEKAGRAPEQPKESSAAGLLSRLALEGTVACTAVIGPGETPGADPVYDVTVEVDGLRARPVDAAADGVRLEDVRGRLRIMPGRFEVPGLSGTMVSGSAGEGADGGGTPIGRLSIVLDQSRGDTGGIDAEVTALDLDIAAPFESLVGVVSAKAAERVRELRAEHHPQGVIDTGVEYRERPGTEPSVSLRIANPRGLAVDALGGRAELSGVTGTVAAVIEGSTSVAFDGVRASVAFNGQPGGEVSVAGEADVGTARRAGPDRVLDLQLRDARFESELTRALVLELGGAAGAEALAESEARGVFGARARVLSGAAGRGVRARIEPSEVSALRSGRRVEAVGITGGVTIERDAGAPPGTARGRVDQLAGRVGAVDAQVDGEWVLGVDGAADASLRVDASAPSLDDATVGLLPERLRSALADRKLRVEGPVAARDARVKWRREASGAEPVVGFAGEIDFARASLDGGVDITDATGVARVDFNGGPEGERWTLDVDAPSLVAQGVVLERAQAGLEGGETLGVRLRSMSADCHGGRLVAQAVTRPSDDSGGPAGYDATITLSGARFAGVLDDFRGPQSSDGGESGVGDPAGASEAEGHSADESRGWIDLTLSLSGKAGKPETRLGGGTVRVSGGEVIRRPFVLPLLEMSNLALPVRSSLDYADAAFRIEGEQLEITHAAIISDAIGLVGYGSVNIPARALDLKFNTLAATRIPLWTDVWETVRNEIVQTAVRGTIDDPTFEPESLGGTRRLLGRVFTSSSAGEGFDPVRVDAAARAERDRIRRDLLSPAAAPTLP